MEQYVRTPTFLKTFRRCGYYREVFTCITLPGERCVHEVSLLQPVGVEGWRHTERAQGGPVNYEIFGSLYGSEVFVILGSS